VGDLEPDLIHMAGEHHPRTPLLTHDGKGVSMDVGPDLLGKLLRLFPPDPGRARLKARGTRLSEKAFEKLDPIVHAKISIFDFGLLRTDCCAEDIRCRGAPAAIMSSGDDRRFPARK